MKLGFTKETTLPNGYTANFWAVENPEMPRQTGQPMDLDRPRNIKVQIWLYKDFDSFVAGAKDTGEMKEARVLLTLSEINTPNWFDKVVERIKETHSFFEEADIVEV